MGLSLYQKCYISVVTFDFSFGDVEWSASSSVLGVFAQPWCRFVIGFVLFLACGIVCSHFLVIIWSPIVCGCPLCFRMPEAVNVSDNSCSSSDTCSLKCNLVVSVVVTFHWSSLWMIGRYYLFTSLIVIIPLLMPTLKPYWNQYNSSHYITFHVPEMRKADGVVKWMNQNWKTSMYVIQI